MAHRRGAANRKPIVQIKWLEDFLALVEVGSFVGAAKRRHITHPAFGRRIRALEAWAGAPLLERDSKVLRLTPRGQVLLEAARDAVASLTAARRAQGLDADNRLVRIATGHTLARTLLPTWYDARQGVLAEARVEGSRATCRRRRRCSKPARPTSC